MTTTIQPRVTRAKRTPAKPKEKQAAYQEDRSPEALRKASINNAAGHMETLFAQHGVTFEVNGSDTGNMLLSAFVEDITQEFTIKGNTNREMIAGCRAYVKKLVGILNRIDAELATTKPTPLPIGEWVHRDSAGHIIYASLYPRWREGIPEGESQTFEPFES